ncbi:winged helix-turn-helix transcriptional regulator [Oxalobacteraceae bacterium]|nr:winged helix-turn-helix transcriptional regulator [Oxalobacteraceae bacterium]
MSDTSKKDQLYELIRANPFISQQDLAAELGLSRSAVAGHIAGLIRERRLLGRAYVLPGQRPLLCIGAANLDRKLRTVAPLQMGTSNPANAEEVFGGVARNIAENLARLKLPTALLTVLGHDAAGRALQQHAEAAGIDTRGSMLLTDAISGTYTAVLDHAGELVVALADMAIYERIDPAFLASRLPQRAGAALTVADLNLPRESIAALLADAARGITNNGANNGPSNGAGDGAPLVIVAVSQPKMARLPARLHGLRLLILNRGELEARAGRALPGRADLAAACRALQADGARDVIVTCGSEGVYYTDGGELAWLAALDVDVVDVTGAGDAFAAAVCWSLYHSADQGKADLAQACRCGLRLSALTLACRSTVVPALDAGLFDDLVPDAGASGASASLPAATHLT